MKFILSLLFSAPLCFGWVFWYYDIIDSCESNGVGYEFNASALDTGGRPCVVYMGCGFRQLIYACRIDTVWTKEIILDTLVPLRKTLSLCIDKKNRPHVHFCYRRNNTYICYATRTDNQWQVQIIDSFIGVHNYFSFHSIDCDTNNLPGIAYIFRDIGQDTLWYVKYAHYNGVSWDIHNVVCDSTWQRRYPLDWSPSLSFSRKTNVPYIAFYRFYGIAKDTIKIARYDEGSNMWVIEPAVINPHGGLPLSLKLNSKNHPCIAHGDHGGAAYSWWDGTTWHTEFCGVGMGWAGTRIDLAIDGFDNPHIAVLPDPLGGYVYYCYKKYGNWSICRVDPSVNTFDSDIGLDLDRNGEPHIIYCIEGAGYCEGLKYAKGTLLGINDDNKYGGMDPRDRFKLSSNISKGFLDIEWQQEIPCGIEIAIYDVCGKKVESIKIYGAEGNNRRTLRLQNLSCGVYFVVLNHAATQTSKKFLFVK